ncbi:hypothetical protein Bca4012_092961 [Brassica carinata]
MMFRLNPNKAPGPDGLTSGFFKASWSLLGDEVAQSIIHFFYTSFLPTSINSTILALIPKRPGASAISDFRPIACLNTVYKVISRLLVKRLKPILPSLIVPNQTAFVKDRLLVENTVLAAELVHGYHKRQGPKHITIKVDIAKAFDTLSWEFLFNCLEGLQLPEVLLKRLKACICSPSFMIGYNGSVQGYFKGRRGLRQGDPLSLYLFVIAMNVLSIMLNKAAQDLKINYHSKCSSSKLTHLCFADDLLIFIDGSLASVQNVLQILRIKDLSTWNKASCLKLVWLLFFQLGSVWVAWFKTEVLDGDVYRKLRNEEEEEVPWAKIVWISAGIQKHGFLTWLFVLNRCPTRDRLLSWGLQTDSVCLLCNAAAESRDHLFFRCPYTWDLWQIIAAKCGLISERDWNDSILQLQQLQGNRLRKRLTYIGWLPAIYWSWNERNNRLHCKQLRTVDSLFRVLDRQIRDKILSMRQSTPINSSRLMQMWL